jgi:large subunit ribosomal protein L9
MKIILTTKNPKLGKVGDIIKVKNGYARSFLIPKGKALILNEENINIISQNKKKKYTNIKRIRRKLENKEIIIQADTGGKDQSKIFGSVEKKDIKEAIFYMFKIKIERKNIINKKKNIRQLGKFKIKVRIRNEEIKCIVNVIRRKYE